MSSADPAPTTAPPASPKPKLGTTDKLLAGILGALVLLVLAVLVLAGTIYFVTRPLPVPSGPTGPTVTVEASATVTNGRAALSLSDASGTTAVVVADALSDNKKSWVRQIAFGESIDLTITASELYTDDETGEPGKVTCMLTVDDKVVSESLVDVSNGIGTCKWTNTGK